MRRSLRALVPLAAAVACGVVGLTAPLAAASPASPAKNVPTAAPAPAAVSSSKVSPVSADKAVTGYQQVVSDLLTDPANTQVAGSMTCPAGTKVIGGGGVISSSNLAENLNGSLPLTDGKTWRVYVNNASATDGTFRVFATCATKIPSYSVVIGTGVDNPSGVQTSASVTCPTGTVALGGGGDGSSTSTAVNLNTSLPLSSGWRVDVNNASAGGDTAFAVAVCGQAPKAFKVTVGTPVTNTAGAQNSGSVTCKTGLVALSGGVFSSSPSIAVDLNSSEPFGSDGWKVYVDNASTGSTSFTPYVVCGKPAA